MTLNWDLVKLMMTLTTETMKIANDIEKCWSWRWNTDDSANNFDWWHWLMTLMMIVNNPEKCWRRWWHWWCSLIILRSVEAHQRRKPKKAKAAQAHRPSWACDYISLCFFYTHTVYYLQCTLCTVQCFGHFSYFNYISLCFSTHTLFTIHSVPCALCSFLTLTWACSV